MNQNYPNIVELLSLYLDGLYQSDVDKLKQVFHPNAHYVCTTDQNLVWYDMNEYFAMVTHRQSPASRNEIRKDNISSIEFAGSAVARARVECAIADKFYIDFLSMIKIDHKWFIISKAFHSQKNINN